MIPRGGRWRGVSFIRKFCLKYGIKHYIIHSSAYSVILLQRGYGNYTAGSSHNLWTGCWLFLKRKPIDWKSLGGCRNMVLQETANPSWKSACLQSEQKTQYAGMWRSLVAHLVWERDSGFFLIWGDSLKKPCFTPISGSFQNRKFTAKSRLTTVLTIVRTKNLIYRDIAQFGRVLGLGAWQWDFHSLRR